MKQKISGEMSRPQAWIAVSNNRQKIYGNNEVYLGQDQEFEIELYNPTSTKYLAKIYFNGKLTSTSGLVLMPGQRYFLDRFLDEDRKLTFTTYDVDSTDQQAMDAIEQNGLVKVEFFAEEAQTLNSWTARTYANPLNWTGTVNWQNSNYGGFNLTSSTNPTWTTTSSGATFTNTSSSAFYSTGISSSNTLSSLTSGASLETGRVERGGKSNQTFSSDFGKYSWWASFTSSYKLLPRSVKPVEVSEIRSYCPECRTRIKKKTWKFCPNCGESLD